jgi:predicted MFS family arabinose efflux permease
MKQGLPIGLMKGSGLPVPSSDPVASSARKRRSPSLAALDALNFFQADVQGGVGPFLVTYLAASLRWAPDRIGLVMFASGILGLCAHAPCGALVDQLKPKRLIVATAAALIALACIAIVQVPSFAVILAGQSFIALAGACFGPAIAAISLGLVGRHGIDVQVGRNASVGSAGNVAMAISAGLVGYLMGGSSIFFFVAVMSLATIASVMSIHERDIDHALARGADDHGAGPHVARIRDLFQDRRLAIFALCAVLFHFANAAVLPLVAELVAQGQNVKVAPLVMSSCVTVTQLTIVFIGLMIGRFAQKFPRKPVYLIAFCALPVRCLLYTLSNNPIWLVAVQILDGVGAGVFGIMQTLVIADLTKATGRFNLAQGVIGMAVGIGASSSNLVGGSVVARMGYQAGFVTMAGIATLALAVFWFAMPETKDAAGAS